MPSKFPLERLADRFEMALELPERMGDFVQRFEVVWRQHFSLDDGEIEFHLIKPTAVNGSMDQLQAGVALLEPLHTGCPPMGGTIVNNPEHAAGLGIGRVGHNPVDQAIKGHNAALRLAVSEKPGPVDVQGRQVSERSAPLVLMFDLHRLAGLGWLGRMDASAGLDAGFFVGGNDELVLLQGLALPDSLVEIQQASGFEGELRVTGKNPTAMKPRSDGVFMEPAPESAITDFGHQPGVTDLLVQFGQTPARERQAKLAGQLASQGFNLHDQFWGEKPGGDPGGEAPLARVGVRGRSVCAIG